MNNGFGQMRRGSGWAILAMLVFASSGVAETGEKLPTLEEALAAKMDVWGEAALHRPEGPTYEFFAKLMPPLRYVNAKFRHYPIVLSAPQNPCKARLVSNGSAINAKAEEPVGWKPDVGGLPVNFLVGPDKAPFGNDVDRLDGPRYAEGYLPIVQMSYQDDEATFREEAFVAAGEPWSGNAAVFTSFRLERGRKGDLAAQIQSSIPLHVEEGALCDENGRAYVWFDKNWRWDSVGKLLLTTLSPKRAAQLVVFTRPVGPLPAGFLSAEMYAKQRQECVDIWTGWLGRGAQLEVPEPVVNNAWRSLVIGNLMIEAGRELNYSASNYYNDMTAEIVYCIRAMMLYGQTEAARPMIESYFDFTERDFLKYFNAGCKLRMMAHYFWLTRDAGFVERNRLRWLPQIERIIKGRDPKTGLLNECYCNDIQKGDYNYNLVSNGMAWAGLRDFAAVLREMGQGDERIEREAKSLRQAILAAVAKSENRSVVPPFVPNAFSGAEKPCDMLTASKLGSYWCLVIPYALESHVLDPAPEKATWIMEYLQQHGGLAMGMIRFHQKSGLFANERGVDDLYSLGYADELLRHDQVDRALVTFYGKLAQGLTRDTFIGGEASGLDPLDKHGRGMYLPPNSAGNGAFLWILRNLVVQDWDADDDGKPDTLRLLFATPRRWLADGAAIRLAGLPTDFGKVSLEVHSRLSQGEVLADVALPSLQPKKVLLRARLPEGWKAVSATIDGTTRPVDDQGVVDLSESRGKVTVRFEVQQIKRNL